MSWYRYLLAIRQQPGWADPQQWRESFTAELRTRSLISLDIDGQIYSGPTPDGFYQFATIDEVAETFANAPWYPVADPPAFVGPVLGYFNWEWWFGHLKWEDRRYFAQVFLGAACGVIARTDDGRAFDVWKHQTLQLGDAAHKSGFCDGEIFPDWDGYRDYVHQCIEAPLSEADLQPEWINYGTSHNPIRISSLRGRPTETHAAAWARLKSIADQPIQVWSYDALGTETDEFRLLLTD